MKKLMPVAAAIALALVAFLPQIAAAKLAVNHNQTVLRG